MLPLDAGPYDAGIPRRETYGGDDRGDLNDPAGPEVVRVTQDEVPVAARNGRDQKGQPPDAGDHVVGTEEVRRVPVRAVDLLAGVLEGERHPRRHGTEGDEDQCDV